jgi:ribosomal protein S16
MIDHVINAIDAIRSEEQAVLPDCGDGLRLPREGRAKDFLGFYNLLTEPAEIKIDLDKAKMWLTRGARASRTVLSLMQKVSKREKLSK